MSSFAVSTEITQFSSLLESRTCGTGLPVGPHPLSNTDRCRSPFARVDLRLLALPAASPVRQPPRPLVCGTCFAAGYGG
jgi:hypothetical protein